MIDSGSGSRPPDYSISILSTWEGQGPGDLGGGRPRGMPVLLPVALDMDSGGHAVADQWSSPGAVHRDGLLERV